MRDFMIWRRHDLPTIHFHTFYFRLLFAKFVVCRFSWCVCQLTTDQILLCLASFVLKLWLAFSHINRNCAKYFKRWNFFVNQYFKNMVLTLPIWLSNLKNDPSKKFITLPMWATSTEPRVFKKHSYSFNSFYTAPANFVPYGTKRFGCRNFLSRTCIKILTRLLDWA